MSTDRSRLAGSNAFWRKTSITVSSALSRIYFHSLYGTAEVNGSERAHMGVTCSDLLLVSMRLGHFALQNAKIYRPMLPPEHYAQQYTDDIGFLRAFSTWLCVGGAGKTFGLTTKVDPFTAALNTAVVMGNDVVKLMARLHGQSEIHAHVLGPNRAWLADIIERGRKTNILRDNMGWPSVIALLRSRDDVPVVTSYSVTNSFPNPEIAGYYDPDNDSEHFYTLPKESQWELGMHGLAVKGGGLEMKPDDWDTFYFGAGTTGFDVMAEAGIPYGWINNPNG